MENTSVTGAADVTMMQFEKRAGKYGVWTMIVGLGLSLLGPLTLVFFGDLDISPSMVWIAFVAVAGTFGTLWVIEPLTYFPVLGPAAMYQAFMIGNISNKLLPAALVAQSSINAKPGSHRGDLAAVMAICGAATVHLTSLLIFVGVLGTWLVGLLPVGLIDVARLYVLPSLIGAVGVQAIIVMKQARTTIVAILVAVVIQFGVLPFVPQLSFYATAIAVLATIGISWVVRDRALGQAPKREPAEPNEIAD